MSHHPSFTETLPKDSSSLDLDAPSLSREERLPISQTDTQKLAQHFLNFSLDGMAALSPIKDRQNNVVDFKILYLNPASSRILKQPIEQIINNTLLNIFPGTKKTKIYPLFLRVYQTSTPDTEEVYYDYDGFSDWFIIKAARADNILIIFFERINQQQCLKQHPPSLQNSFKLNETILEYLLQKAPFGLALINSEGQLYCLNGNYCKIYGYECHELCGKSFLTIVPKESQAYWKKEYTNFLQNPYSHSFTKGREATRIRKNGSKVNIWFNSKQITFSNGEKATIHIAIDITERKRLENALLALHDQRQIELGHTLHEGLCQELASLSFFAEILHKKIQKGKNVKKEIPEITKMLHGMLEYTRNLSHSLSIEVNWHNFASMINNLKLITKKQGGITCKINISSPKQKKNTQHIPQQLYFIAQEAITNAIKHGHCKSIEISLKQNKDSMIFKIINDGVPFITPQSSTPKGLGMHLMRFRTERLGGFFSINAEKRSDTVVECYIPIKKSP